MINLTELPKRLKEKELLVHFYLFKRVVISFAHFVLFHILEELRLQGHFQKLKMKQMELINSGVKEIILLGQNVNAWTNSYDKMDFADLIYELSLLDIKRIRFTTSHPNDMNQKLISSLKILKNFNHIFIYPFSLDLIKF